MNFLMKKIILSLIVLSTFSVFYKTVNATDVLSDPFISESACKAVLYKNNLKYPDYDRSACFQKYWSFYYKICDQGTACSSETKAFIKNDNLHSVNNYINNIVNPEQEQQIKKDTKEVTTATQNEKCKAWRIDGYSYTEIKNEKSSYWIREIFAWLQYHRIDCKNGVAKKWQFYNQNHSSVSYVQCYDGYTPYNLKCKKTSNISLQSCKYWSLDQYSYAGFTEWEIQTAYLDIFWWTKEIKIICDQQWNVQTYNNPEFITRYTKCTHGYKFQSHQCVIDK